MRLLVDTCQALCLNNVLINPHPVVKKIPLNQVVWGPHGPQGSDVLIINKPFKYSPFLAGFPGTNPSSFSTKIVREKPAIWGLVRLNSRCLLISWK